MSVFDDPNFHVDVGGIEVDPEDLDELIREDEEENPSPRVSWKVVDRWCREHPLQVRLFLARPAQTTTHLRQWYPHLSVRAVRHRPRPEATKPTQSRLCDVLVVFVPEGEVDPLEVVPGMRVTLGAPSAPRT